MGLFDIILLIIIAGFGLFGLWFGFIHTMGSLVGTVVGAFVASRYYGSAADVLVNITGWSENVSRVLMFILVFLVINRFVGFLFWTLEKTLRIAVRLPFIQSINRILGLVLGVFEGLVTIGLILYVMEVFPISDNISFMMAHSLVAPIALGISEILLPLLPEGMRLLETGASTVESVI